MKTCKDCATLNDDIAANCKQCGSEFGIGAMRSETVDAPLPAAAAVTAAERPGSAGKAVLPETDFPKPGKSPPMAMVFGVTLACVFALLIATQVHLPGRSAASPAAVAAPAVPAVDAQVAGATADQPAQPGPAMVDTTTTAPAQATAADAGHPDASPPADDDGGKLATAIAGGGVAAVVAGSTAGTARAAPVHRAAHARRPHKPVVAVKAARHRVPAKRPPASAGTAGTHAAVAAIQAKAPQAAKTLDQLLN